MDMATRLHVFSAMHMYRYCGSKVKSPGLPSDVLSAGGLVMSRIRLAVLMLPDTVSAATFSIVKAPPGPV
eukprot:6202206-Pleurochrysis_carterae.AAC.1